MCCRLGTARGKIPASLNRFSDVQPHTSPQPQSFLSFPVITVPLFLFLAFLIFLIVVLALAARIDARGRRTDGVKGPKTDGAKGQKIKIDKDDKDNEDALDKKERNTENKYAEVGGVYRVKQHHKNKCLSLIF